MKDSVQFSGFVTSIEQANEAVHEAIDAATHEIYKLQSDLGAAWGAQP